MSKIVIWLLPLIFFHFEVLGQAEVTISGRVIDSQTLLPVEDASVYLKRNGAGTITNSTGEFALHVDGVSNQDSITVSHLGYASFALRITDLQQNFLNVLLQQAPKLLGEVVVGDTMLTRRQIIEKARNAVRSAFSSESAILTAYHRSWEIVTFSDSAVHPGTFIEAAVRIYDPGYQVSQNKSEIVERVQWDEIRRTRFTEGWNHTSSWLEVLLRENLVKYQNRKIWFVIYNFFDFSHPLEYELIGTDWLDGEALYQIQVEVQNERNIPATYTLYVSQRDFALRQFDLTGGARQHDSTKAWNLERVNYRYTFMRINEVPYLATARVNYVISNIDTSTGLVRRKEEYFRELIVNHVETKNVESIVADWKRKPKGTLSDVGRAYNADFWKSFNVVLDNPMDERIIKLFELSSDDAFKRSSKNADK